VCVRCRRGGGERERCRAKSFAAWNVLHSKVAENGSGNDAGHENSRLVGYKRTAEASHMELSKYSIPCG